MRGIGCPADDQSIHRLSRAIERQPLRLTAGRWHDVHLARLGTAPGERDPATVRRVVGCNDVARIMRKPLGESAGQRDGPEFAMCTNATACVLAFG